MYTINEAVSRNMKQMRLAKNVTQKQVAQATGISRQSISNLENGMGFSIKTIETIAEYLDVSPLSFFSEDGQGDEDLPFRRVRNGDDDTAVTVDTTEDFTEKVGELAKNHAESLKKGLYLKCVVPSVDRFFESSTPRLFDILGIAGGRGNTKTMGQFKDALLKDIRMSVFTDGEPDDLIMME